jgi:hypothetical protein
MANEFCAPSCAASRSSVRSLGVAREVADRVVFMADGEVVELFLRQIL